MSNNTTPYNDRPWLLDFLVITAWLVFLCLVWSTYSFLPKLSGILICIVFVTTINMSTVCWSIPDTRVLTLRFLGHDNSQRVESRQLDQKKVQLLWFRSLDSSQMLLDTGLLCILLYYVLLGFSWNKSQFCLSCREISSRSLYYYRWSNVHWDWYAEWHLEKYNTWTSGK